MKRSTFALLALVVIAAAALLIAWRIFDSRGLFAPVPTAAPTALATPDAPPAALDPTPTTALLPTGTPADFLTATLAPAHDPHHYAARTPLTILFDRPIAAPPDRPLVFTPSVPGTFSWNDDATAVTFNPTRGFSAGHTYTVTASDDLRAADGAIFDAPPVWSLVVVEPPRVLRRQPAQGAGRDRRPAISVIFDRPMDPATAAVAVEPAVPLDLSWPDETTLVIRPAADLDPGVTYKFALAKEVAGSDGIPRDQAYRFTYTPSPIITAVEGPKPNNPDAPFFIRFGYPMDRAAAEAALTLSPPVEAARRWQGDDTLELIDPPLMGNTTYTITLAGDVADADGNLLPVAAAKPVTYKTASPLVEAAPSGSGVHPAAQLRWVFDRPMDAATTADALSISPSTNGEITWADETTLLFSPDGGSWQPLTKYSVTLSTHATDAGGRPVLGEPLALSFTTSEIRRLADWGIGPQTQVLDAGGRRAVQFQSSINDPVSLSFDLLPVDPTGFLNRLVGDVTSGWSAPADPIADDGLSPAVSWTTVTRPGDPKRWANPQETLIPADAPPGLYLLRLNGPQPAHLLLALTRLTLVAKLSEGEVVVWVTDIPSVGDDGTDSATTHGGEAVLNAAVSVYAQNGRLLAEGATDERGVARLALPADAEPYAVFAQSGDDITFSGLTPELQSVGEYYNWDSWDGSQPVAFAPPAFAIHVQTDRPIYRPGQNVFYKAIVRLDDDGAVSLPPEGTQVIVRLRDARDNLVRTKFLATDEFGAVYDSFDVAEGAMLGEYAIEVEPVRPDGGPDPATRQTFQIEEYRKPDFSVTITPGSPDLLAGDLISVTIDAQYLFGEPVANARVAIKRFRLYDYYWGDNGNNWEMLYDEFPLSATTDATGRAVFAVPAVPRDLNYSSWGYNPMNWRMAVEATVNDGSNQTVSAATVVTVHRAAEVVSLETSDFFVNFGDEAPFTATVMTTVGGDPAPVEGRTLRGTLRAWSSSTYQYDQVVADYEWSTDANGVISAFLTPPAPGYYRLRLNGSDDDGRPLFAETYIYALGAGESGFWGSEQSSALAIAANRETYAPGDTAQLLINSSFAGPALLTFERASVRREMPVYLTPPVTAVDIDILPEDAPNIFVTVNAWKPLSTVLPDPDSEAYWQLSSSLRDAQLVTASVELSVPVLDRTLSVVIETDRDVYAPREEAAVTIRVTDAAGQPVRAQVALAMVDEAIFLLAADNTRPLYDAFYGPRPNRVATRDALAPGRYLYEGGLGGGGGDGGGTPRSDFPDTAAWFPALVTDANGEIRVNIPLADSLTTWRLTARAVTGSDTQVGEAVHKFTTHQDVIVRPILPRGLTVGDALTLSAIVHNYGDEAAELTVSLAAAATDALAITEPVSQTITLEPGATRVVGWPVEALAEVSTPVVVRAARSDGSGDAVELILDVRALAVPIHDHATGVIDGAGDVAFDVPADALPTSAVTLEISRSPAGSLLNGLEYLTGFPYGCVEQTMSRALPNAVVSRAFNQLGIPPPELLDLDKLVNESAQRLYGLQHDDGGWGWWYDDATETYQTAWVLFGLATMAEGGHEIDPAVIERGAAYLRQHLRASDPRIRAYVLYSLAAARPILDEAGIDPAATATGETAPVDEAAVALELLSQVEGNNPLDLDAFSLAALALTLDKAGEADAAQRVMDRLAATVEIDDDLGRGAMAHWGTTGDGQYNNKVMASATRSTALALSAFVKLRPGDDLEPLIVNYLMDRRRGDGWGTTNETAHAIIGLTDHLLGTGLGQTSAAYGVALNGAPLPDAELTAGELRDVIELPFDRLLPGANTVTLTAADGGRLYYVLNGRYRAPRDVIDAGGVLEVERHYLVGDSEVDMVAAGDVVRVRVTVRVPRDTFYVVVEDRVPAGLEPLNERLNTTSHDAAPDYNDPDWRQYQWQYYGYNQKEIREGQVNFFATTLPRGLNTFEYMARATHAGTFTALPAEAWAMYEPETWGRSASGVLAVEE
ncbi:MAG: Ig-like domain-containing protein [Candidatus Promineofilum sp.]|nr:Ig-like domain-containing protein [Promineifilum sp.]